MSAQCEAVALDVFPGKAGASALEPISVRIKTAVQLTGLGRSTIYALIGAGRIETVKVGRATLVTYRSLRALIEAA